jgi:hypothetical protein
MALAAVRESTSKLVGKEPAGWIDSKILARTIRFIWLAIGVLVLYVLVVRIQVLLHQVERFCTGPSCALGQVSRSEAHALEHLRLPTHIVGYYVAALRVVFEATFLCVGAILIWRKPNDRIAALAAFALLLFGGLTASASPQIPSEVPEPIYWIANALTQLGFLMLTMFFYFFPDGRPVLRPVGVFLLLAMILQLFPEPFTGTLANIVSAIGLLLPSVAIIYVQVYRYRRVSDQRQRQQTKWVVYAIVTGLSAFFITLAAFSLPGFQSSLFGQTIGATAIYLSYLIIPLAIGTAMLRYRLWDVDVLINRTLVYGLLSVSLAALYIGSVVVLEAALRRVTGQGSGLAVAISTLFIAAIFQPFRRGLQSFIDRRFYRRKYDAARTLAAFSNRLRDSVDLDRLSAEIMGVVGETIQPSAASLWLRPSRSRGRQ